EAVHDRAEHAHVVGACAVEAALGELRAAEEVAAADDDGDLDALGDRVRDLPGDALDDVGRETDLPAAERLARELEEHAPVRGTRSGRGLLACRHCRHLSFVLGPGGAVILLRRRPPDGAPRRRSSRARATPGCAVGPAPSSRDDAAGPTEASGADAVPHELRDGAAGLGDDLADRLLRVLRERLVLEDDVLEEAVQATLDDLRERGLGLALVARGLLGDAALVLDRLGRDLV